MSQLVKVLNAASLLVGLVIAGLVIKSNLAPGVAQTQVAEASAGPSPVPSPDTFCRSSRLDGDEWFKFCFGVKHRLGTTGLEPVTAKTAYVREGLKYAFGSVDPRTFKGDDLMECLFKLRNYIRETPLHATPEYQSPESRTAVFQVFMLELGGSRRLADAFIGLTGGER